MARQKYSVLPNNPLFNYVREAKYNKRLYLHTLEGLFSRNVNTFGEIFLLKQIWGGKIRTPVLISANS